jgi:hypothetical protein
MLMCVVSHAFMQHWESVSTSEKRESSDRKLLYNYVLFYVVTMVVYVFNLCGDICVQWRQVCAVETVIATPRMFNM